MDSYGRGSHPKLVEVMINESLSTTVKTEFIKVEPPDIKVDVEIKQESDEMMEESEDGETSIRKTTEYKTRSVYNTSQKKQCKAKAPKKLTKTKNKTELKKSEIFQGECDSCNRIFGCKISLTKHIDKHLQQQTCKTCNIFYRTTSEFICHVKQYHVVKSMKSSSQGGDPKRNICNICDKCFTRPSNLKVHQRIHTNERPFSCDKCDKTFIKESNLIRHISMHSDNEDGYKINGPFICEVCVKTFAHRGALKRHQRIHTEERPFNCLECSKKFADETDLKHHELTHTNKGPFICNVCDKSFTLSCTLENHERTHTELRPFECNICQKTFKMSNHLTVHQRTHTNERPYVCNVCDKTFAYKHPFKRHMMSDHPNHTDIINF